jgi:hypothetical protein
VLAAAVLVSAQPAGAYSFLDRAYGTPQLGLSARSRAMGGAGAAMSDGVFSLVDNPGNLVLLRGNRGSSQAYGPGCENRLVPLDTFDCTSMRPRRGQRQRRRTQGRGPDRWGSRA